MESYAMGVRVGLRKRGTGRAEANEQDPSTPIHSEEKSGSPWPKVWQGEHVCILMHQWNIRNVKVTEALKFDVWSKCKISTVISK